MAGVVCCEAPNVNNLDGSDGVVVDGAADTGAALDAPKVKIPGAAGAAAAVGADVEGALKAKPLEAGFWASFPNG